MLTVSQITCERGHRPLFAPASFSLARGQALHLQGDNGVGKTSLLRIVCGLSPAVSGEVRWQGRLVRDVATEFRAALFYLGHALSLKENLNALENLMADAAVRGHDLSAAQAQAALRRIGLRGREALPVRVMSQGQKRRVALARLMISTANLWVLDEPFVALDPQAVDQLRRVLGQHVAAGGMLLLTSHQPVSLLDAQGHEVAVAQHRLEASA
jgi:heme exporter protein A